MKNKIIKQGKQIMCCECDEMPTAYWEYQRIARKKHVCCECGSDIDPGEKYFQVKGIWNAEFMTFNTCEICNRIRNKVSRELDYCIPFEYLYEIIVSEFEI